MDALDILSIRDSGKALMTRSSGTLIPVANEASHQHVEVDVTSLVNAVYP